MNTLITADKVPRPRAGKTEDYMSLAPGLEAIAKHKWLVAAVAVLTLLLGCAYALLAPPVYQANILIKVDVSDASLKSIPANLSGIFDL
ncbi:MAG: Tyrosine-protein kinase Wzc, partial [Variovorax sp.]|nr:Tyrosine-protein kinase Wzc [Variovorax sp.]